MALLSSATVAYAACTTEVQSAAELACPSGLVSGGQQFPDAAPLTAWQWPDAILATVLWDNGPLVTNPGAGSGGADVSALQTSLGLNTYGFGHQVSADNRVADDFTVTGGGWDIDNITFFAYQTNSTTVPTITSLNLRIWDGPPDDLSSTVMFGDTTTDRLVAAEWSNIYRTLDTDLSATNRPVMALETEVNTTLAAGTYWVDWQVDGSLASGPWAPPISILGETSTGNAMQWIGASTTWGEVLDTGIGTPQGLPFIIQGRFCDRNGDGRFGFRDMIIYWRSCDCGFRDLMEFWRSCRRG